MAELLRTEADQAVSGPGRHRPRRFPASEQRAALHHRAKWRRQDHLHQHDLGPPGRAPATSGTRASASPSCPSPPAPSGGIGRKFQTPSVFDNLSVFENIELAVLASARGQDASARIARVLHLVRLEHQTGILARNLSHGQRQWLEIGLLLANDAKLLLLDEPTAGMTAEETSATGELIRQLDASCRSRRSSSSTISTSSAAACADHGHASRPRAGRRSVRRDRARRRGARGLSRRRGMSLEVDNVTAGYGLITVLREVSMQVIRRGPGCSAATAWASRL